MLELIFVLVVIGILAAIISPEMRSNKIREAAIQLVSHIRYTQHLAMIDDKFDSSDSDWYRDRWQLMFRSTIKETSSGGDTIPVWAYTIYSDSLNQDGNPNITDDIAMNPSNSDKFLSGGFSTTISQEHPKRDSSMDLRGEYGVLQVDFTGGCSAARRIAFDHLGRPYFGAFTNTSIFTPYDHIMVQDCNISICTVSPCPSIDGDNKVTITVESETGYAHIL